MSSMKENNIDNSLTPEDLLWPPSIPFLSVLMMTIGSCIAGFVVGAMIFIMLYIFLGNFSLDTGASPILLSMITFFSLTTGLLIVYFIASLVFPETYTRSVTAISQITIFSIILYIFFAPVYLIVSNSYAGIPILSVFSLHVMLSVFGFFIVISVVSQYRYVLLSVYASFAAFLFTGIIWALYILPMNPSTQALVILIGLVMLAFMGNTFFVYTVGWAYSSFYKSTGLDPVGSVFSRIEKEEKDIEKQVTEQLTKF